MQARLSDIVAERRRQRIHASLNECSHLAYARRVLVDTKATARASNEGPLGRPVAPEGSRLALSAAGQWRSPSNAPPTVRINAVHGI